VQATADVQAQSAAHQFSGVRGAGRGSELRAAQSDLTFAQANLEKAKLDYDRGQGLFKDGLIPKQDFDQRDRYDGAAAAVESARSAFSL